MAKENDIGKPAPKTDLHGAWMKQCGDGFGLRITRAEPTAPYVISFCGPGGCADEDGSRKSYITGDARFQVVSPDELKERQDDTWVTWHRCNKK